MNEELRSQITRQFQEYQTEELLEIWTANNRAHWSDLAFDVIREILYRRNTDIPPQNEPKYEYLGEESATDLDDDAFEEADRDGEEQPVFYKPGQVLWLTEWLVRLAYAAVAVTILSNLANIIPTQNTIYSDLSGYPLAYSVSWIITLSFIFFITAISCILYFLALQALADILNILMEMEFNSRGVK